MTAEYIPLPAEENYVRPVKGRVLEWGVRMPKDGSKSVGVFLRMHCLELFDMQNKVWDSLLELEQVKNCEIISDTYVIRKDGQVNETGRDQLARAIGWDGTFAFFKKPVPPKLIVIATTILETYNDKPRIKVEWINEADFVPGSQGILRRATEVDLDGLDAQYAAQFRATAKPLPPK